MCVREGALRLPVLLHGYERDLPRTQVCVCGLTELAYTPTHT